MGEAKRRQIAGISPASTIIAAECVGSFDRRHQSLVLWPIGGRSRYSEGLLPQRSKVKLMLVGNAGMGQLSKRSAAI